MNEITTLDIKNLPLEQFVERYTDLVKRIAYQLTGRLPSQVMVDDMIQSGMIGLLEARDKFSQDKGASFETFASIRIRGAMLDELRKGDWAPRSVYRAAREIAEVVRQLEHKMGRDAKDHEIAQAMNLSLNEYHQVLQDATCVRISGYEDGGLDDDNMGISLFSKLWSPQESFSDNRFKHALAEAIAGLPERERLVISLYYQDELNLKDIGEILSVTESRVCQIHSQAVIRLRSRLKEWE